MSYVVYNRFIATARNLVTHSNGKLFPARLNGKPRWEYKKLELKVPNPPLPKEFDWQRDMFINLIRLVDYKILYAPINYEDMRHLLVSSKGWQRKVITELGISTPPVFDAEFENKFIVRPPFHHAGKGFIKVDSLEAAYDEAKKLGNRAYISQVVPFEKEFRVIYGNFNGEPQIIAVLLKKAAEGYWREDGFPIGHHLNSKFITVHNEVNNKLLLTTFFDDVKGFFEKYPYQFMAFDVGYQTTERYKNGNDKVGRYWVFEMNFAPEVTIQNTLDKILTARGLV